MSDTYSRLLGWEVWNFMAFKHASVSFDEKNILNFKGYNDSGKSAMCLALNILMTNTDPNKQVDFIHDECDYFRVVAYFDDDIKILRDKYINGQSLYEMYKGEELIFTTKNGKALTRVSEVPQPIQEYLGLISYDNTYLNFRSCIDKQFGAETTGSENYLAFNTVLKAEELASATQMLNNDKNRLVADMSGLENELYVTKQMCTEGNNITDEMVDTLTALDKTVDTLDIRGVDAKQLNDVTTSLSAIPVFPAVEPIETAQFDTLCNLANMKKEVEAIVDYPVVETIDTGRLDEIAGLSKKLEELKGLPTYPEVTLVDTKQIDEISVLWGISQELNTLVVAPAVDTIDSSQLEMICNLRNLLSEIGSCDAKTQQIDGELIELGKTVEQYSAMLQQMGIKMVKCPNCGQMFDSEVGCC